MLKLSIEQCRKSLSEVHQMLTIPYSSAVGSIVYDVLCCRPDLGFVMSVISRYMGNSGNAHWEAVKTVLRYIKESTGVGLSFNATSNFDFPLVGFMDADYALNVVTRMSITGFIFTLFGTSVS